MDHALTADLKRGFEAALTEAAEALKAEGFGILTEVDVRATLAQKLGVEMRHYKILGACNPPFAHAALELNPLAGLMMPCNVVVYELGPNHTMVAAANPRAMAASLSDARLNDVANGVYDKLIHVMARLRERCA